MFLSIAAFILGTASVSLLVGFGASLYSARRRDAAAFKRVNILTWNRLDVDFYNTFWSNSQACQDNSLNLVECSPACYI